MLTAPNDPVDLIDSKVSNTASEVPLRLAGIVSYAVPTTGTHFFYTPMWSILPGIYAKYFGLKLTSIAVVVLGMRLFEGVTDTAIGYLSDLHRSRGGSRKNWVMLGSLSAIPACYFLLGPPIPATVAYYLIWSMVYFLTFTVGEIPHLTWGSELTQNYHGRAQVFGVRLMVSRLGEIAFYMLPLLPIYATSDYTPRVLHDAIYVGGSMILVGALWMFFGAPSTPAVRPDRRGDSWPELLDSVVYNRPLLLYVAAFGCLGLAGGMWFGLVFFYLVSYLGLGTKVALMFLLATIISSLSTPAWLKIIHSTSKSWVWAVGVLLFCVQLIVAMLIPPGTNWLVPFVLVVVANLFFICHDLAAQSSLGDIVDYGKLKFYKDRGATYYGLNNLIFKFGLGIGGGASIAVAGLFGFDPSNAVHSAASILGMKLGFAGLPLIFAVAGLVFILRAPIDPRRHRIIQLRLESRPTSSGN